MSPEEKWVFLEECLSLRLVCLSCFHVADFLFVPAFLAAYRTTAERPWTTSPHANTSTGCEYKSHLLGVYHCEGTARTVGLELRQQLPSPQREENYQEDHG